MSGGCGVRHLPEYGEFSKFRSSGFFVGKNPLWVRGFGSCHSRQCRRRAIQAPICREMEFASGGSAESQRASRSSISRAKNSA